MSKENVTDENTESGIESQETNQNEALSDEELDNLFESHVSGEEVQADEQDEFDDEPGVTERDNKEENQEKSDESSRTGKEGPSSEDLEKERKVTEQINKGKNYIDQELLNSIEDPELKQKVWSLANTASSHHGRLTQREQENRQLKERIAQLERERNSQPDPATQAQKNEQDKAHQAKINRLKEDYPDLAESIQALTDSTFKEKSQELRELIDQEYGPMRQRVLEESRQLEKQRLEEAAQSIFRTNETGVSYRDVVASPEFSAWLQAQPESIQKFADSDIAAEASRLLQMFEHDYSREYRNQYGRDWFEDVKANMNQAEETPSSANSANDPTANEQAPTPNKADEIAARRDQTRRTAVTRVTPSRSHGSNSTPPDLDTLFDQYASKSTRR